MKKISIFTKSHLPETNKIKILREVKPVIPQKTSSLERTPEKEYFDFSTEELGYFTRRDKDGKILEIIKTIFPR